MSAKPKHPKKPPGPKLQPVESKMIKALGWEPDAPGSDHGTMHVQFSDGTMWKYDKVPRQRWQNFQSAPSKGAFFHHQVKNHFDGRRVKG